MANLGRQPEMRAKIDAALERYERDEGIEEDVVTLSDWAVMRHATAAQACRFEAAFERYGSAPMPVVTSFLKVVCRSFRQSATLRGAGRSDAFARAAAAETVRAAEMLTPAVPEATTEAAPEAKPEEGTDAESNGGDEEGAPALPLLENTSLADSVTGTATEQQRRRRH